jgi:ribosome-associated protein
MDPKPLSRTRKKKEDRALQALGEALVALPPDQLAALNLPVELSEAIQLARKTRQHGARRRQFQYIGALMRHIDTAPIQKALANIRSGDLKKAQAFKRIEAWRDGLRDGRFEMIEDILVCCPQADRQQLAQLARNACREAQDGGGPSASRKLFRYLQKISAERKGGHEP